MASTPPLSATKKHTLKACNEHWINCGVLLINSLKHHSGIFSSCSPVIIGRHSSDMWEKNSRGLNKRTHSLLTGISKFSLFASIIFFLFYTHIPVRSATKDRRSGIETEYSWNLHHVHFLFHILKSVQLGNWLWTIINPKWPKSLNSAIGLK